MNPNPSTTIQVSDGVRKMLAVLAAQRQTELGRSARVPYSEVIEYLIEHYSRCEVQHAYHEPGSAP